MDLGQAMQTIRVRIALLGPGYPPGAGGGIGANAATVAKALAAAAHEVLIVAWVRGPEQQFSDGDVSVLLLESRGGERLQPA
jgi:hypothetical protein